MAGSLILGFAVGGMIDGIVLHQLLQWHSLASAQIARDSVAGLHSNVFWDGAFHLATTLLAAVGFILLWRCWQRSDQARGNAPALLGLAMIGWGSFHAVDQLLFHELLNLHDIREGSANAAVYNWGFFAVGAVLGTAGWTLLRSRGQID